MTEAAFRNRSGETGGSDLSEEDRSKDKFFQEVAALSNSMIAAHGRDFAMGALILAARFIAENKAFTKDPGTKDHGGAACCGGACQSSGNQKHDHAHHKS
jgi:hypothetical protein